MDKQFSVQVVKGGFLLQTSGANQFSGPEIEIFVTQNKLMKAIKTFIDGDEVKDTAEVTEPQPD